jgi:hypothetical protein
MAVRLASSFGGAGLSSLNAALSTRSMAKINPAQIMLMHLTLDIYQARYPGTLNLEL